LYSTDFRWFKVHIADLARDYDGKLWTQSIAWPKENPPEAWGITCLTGDTSKPGFATDPGVIHCGQNSGFAACNLAYHLGGRGCRIILLGFDMMMDGDKRHWFGAHPAGLEVQSNYANFMRNFATIDQKALDVEIWNCSRRTALTCFPHYNLDDL